MDFRADRIVKVYGEREESPQQRLRDKDKRRAAYHRFYTDMKWGHAQNYDLTLNSGTLGIDPLRPDHPVTVLTRGTLPADVQAFLPPGRPPFPAGRFSLPSPGPVSAMVPAPSPCSLFPIAHQKRTPAFWQGSLLFAVQNVSSPLGSRVIRALTASAGFIPWLTTAFTARTMGISTW